MIINNLAFSIVLRNYNLNKKVFEDKKVINKFIKPVSKSVTWLEILLENGKKVTITSNHLVLTKNGYKEAKLLSLEDEIISY